MFTVFNHELQPGMYDEFCLKKDTVDCAEGGESNGHDKSRCEVGGARSNRPIVHGKLVRTITLY